MKMSRKAHRWIGVQNAVFYILLLVIIGLLGFLGREFRFEADWTYGGRNSLSEPTKALLESLEQPLKFVAYIPENPGLQAQLEKLVSRYQRVKPDTSIEFVNPDLDPVRAQQDGIAYAGQLAVHLGARSEVLEVTGEQALANAILRMSRGNERLVVFIEGHGERRPLAQESNGMSQLVSVLERKGFKVQPHSLVRTQSVPQNASFAVIAAPQEDWLPGEVDVLKNYVEQGGNLLWLHDPGGLRGLQPLEELLGLQIYAGTVIDANEALQLLLGINHPAVVPVVDYGRSEIVQNLEGKQTVFPFATMVARDPLAAEENGALIWQYDEILTSLPSSWLETSGSLEGAVRFDEGSGDQAGPLPVGMALTRILEAPEETAEETAEETVQEQRVLVVGDSDFMLNSFIGQGANLDLASNMFNWLSVDDDLLEVPVIRAPDTRLELSETAGFVLAVFFLFVLPGGLLLAGLLIWWRRRKR